MRPRVPWPSDERLRELARTKTGGEIARMLGCTAEAVNGRLRMRGLREETPVEDLGPSSVTVHGDGATVVTDKDAEMADVFALMERRGLDPDEWIVDRATVNEWEAQGPEGTTVPLHQLKVSLVKRASVLLVVPATHVPKLVKPKPRKRSASRPEVVVVEADHHAPYHDEDLDAAMTALVAELQPDQHIFAGDLGDYPTISKHVDHPAAMASPQECVEASYHILRRRREAAPNARARMLLGNHDWRPRAEMLARAERLDNLRPATEDIPLMDLRRALQLPALDVELVEDPRGWEHADIELVPGRDGLIVRHGFITGENTAKKTLDKAGRTVLYAHKHERAMYCRLDYPERVQRQAVGMAAMCRNDVVFPHYAKAPNWQQGGCVVSIWPDQTFQIEHAEWTGKHLIYRGQRY